MLLMIGLVPSFMKNPSLASVLCFFQCGESNALRRMSQLVEFLRFVNKPSSERAVPLKSCCDKVMVCCGKVGNSDFGTARSLTRISTCREGCHCASAPLPQNLT